LQAIFEKLEIYDASLSKTSAKKQAHTEVLTGVLKKMFKKQVKTSAIA